jgi:hypothetical protein
MAPQAALASGPLTGVPTRGFSVAAWAELESCVEQFLTDLGALLNAAAALPAAAPPPPAGMAAAGYAALPALLAAARSSAPEPMALSLARGEAAAGGAAAGGEPRTEGLLPGGLLRDVQRSDSMLRSISDLIASPGTATAPHGLLVAPDDAPHAPHGGRGGPPDPLCSFEEDMALCSFEEDMARLLLAQLGHGPEAQPPRQLQGSWSEEGGTHRESGGSAGGAGAGEGGGGEGSLGLGAVGATGGEGPLLCSSSQADGSPTHYREYLQVGRVVALTGRACRRSCRVARPALEAPLRQSWWRARELGWHRQAQFSHSIRPFSCACIRLVRPRRTWPSRCWRAAPPLA